MSGNETGKKGRCFDEAQKLYVEGFKGIDTISRESEQLLGEYVSAVSLRKWKQEGEWDRKRAEYQRNVKSLPDLIQGVTARLIKKIAEKDLEKIDASDMDMLAKANRICQDHRDPREIVKIGINTIDRLVEVVMAEEPELGKQLAPFVGKILEQLEEENNG